ncbi:lambda exonuclease family protein [Kytococcus sedentarius]|uniref:lambda exonuclease family protein n=1 Tax=Kytococcus sedentarius TaxID=1276 RepID=UPI00387A6FE0
MKRTTYEHMEQRSDEWLAARAGILTASTIGKMLTWSKPAPVSIPCPKCDAAEGMPCQKIRGTGDLKTIHPERTAELADAPTVLRPATGDAARTLTLTLAAERITGHVEDTPTTAAMWRGIEEEPLARAHYEETRGVTVEEVGFIVLENRGMRVGYSPDGLVGDDGLIEIKSRNQREQVVTVTEGQVPAYHMAQLQCALLVSGREWIDYCSYAGGMAMWVARITPDPMWQAMLYAAVETFEQNVQAIVHQYQQLTDGLPTTERTPTYDEIVV